MNEHVASLWPPPAVVRRERFPRGEGSHYLAVPSVRGPRLLIPNDVRGADRMLVRHGGARRTRLARAMLRAAHRCGLSSWMPVSRLVVSPEPSGIEAHVTRVMGRPVRLGVLLGPPRANIKPVLQLFDVDGRTVAFAKVATSTISASLLDAEAAALRRLERRPVPGVLAPQLVDISAWRDRLVLVQTALPAAQSSRQPTILPTAALAAIAASGGIRRSTLDASAFWHTVRDVGPSHWHGLDVSAFAHLRDAIDPAVECSFGAWHGDFAPWNAACGEHHLEVWDWERFEEEVPAGLDAAHWRAQVDVWADPAATWSAMCHDAEQVISALGTPSSGAVTAACYLLNVWMRYRHDAAEFVTPDLRARTAWLCDVARAALPDMKETRP